MDTVVYVGLSNFLTLRKGGLYIDKTDILDELAPLLQSSTSLIVNRPRRFGKSLMISMIEAFYSADLDSASFFDDLRIAVNIQRKCHIGSFSENVTFWLASDHGFSSFHGRKRSFSLADSKEERFMPRKSDFLSAPW